ncbi:MAG: hypothetical protein CVU39_11095 [Chloroflexi bacterium HGW-Chloroflexi-10]|nr:MAG: hypothetical protein CVU39_11095 [Chloroflexi bacterium HGW-Chloroflexi-10]
MRDQNLLEWNERQKDLRLALNQVKDLENIRSLFLIQHGSLHSSQVAEDLGWHYEDEIWHALDENLFRRIPVKQEHSIAWIFWHLTRIEDMTMAALVAGEEQLFDRDNWQARMRVPFRDTGNAMSMQSITELSALLDMSVLRDYRVKVGKQTQSILNGLQLPDFQQKTDSKRITHLLDQGDIQAEAAWLAEYWGGLTVAGLLLMPPTRHILVHLNEAARLKLKKV